MTAGAHATGPDVLVGAEHEQLGMFALHDAHKGGRGRDGSHGADPRVGGKRIAVGTQELLADVAQARRRGKGEHRIDVDADREYVRAVGLAEHAGERERVLAGLLAVASRDDLLEHRLLRHLSTLLSGHAMCADAEDGNDGGWPPAWHPPTARIDDP